MDEKTTNAESLKVPQEILERLHEMENARETLIREHEKFLEENGLIWPFSKCRELKCRHTHGQKTQCGTWGCVHSRECEGRFFNYTDKYEKIEKVKKVKELPPHMGLEGKYVFCYHKRHGEEEPRGTEPLALVTKETDCMLFLSNGDKINKREMGKYVSTQWATYGYSIRPATDDDIQKYSKKKEVKTDE